MFIDFDWTIILIWIGAIFFTGFALYVTIQSYLLGLYNNRISLILWVIAGMFWAYIFLTSLINYLLRDKMALILIAGLVWLYILFVPKSNSKRGKKRK